ncbi:MAG: sodium/proton-translocating pyrophosphatase, partial [Propionibacteriaceae bacterium]|nr:sodium/proton-translocating pyrophosphatase [Propionibacteriaceae bacterium]
MDLTLLLYFVPVAGLISIIMAVIIAVQVLRQGAGDEQMREIADAIQEGAMAYLARQYRTIAVVAAILAVIIGFALEWGVAVSFIIGALASTAAGFLGMNVSVRANVRTAFAAQTSLAKALNVAFRGGAVTGLAVVGLS